MKSLTIQEMWKISSRNNTPLLAQVGKLLTLPFMADYLEHFPELDRAFAKERGHLAPLENREELATDAEILEEFREDVYARLMQNRWRWQHMWDLVNQEYDPTINYDRHEEGYDENSGRDVTVMNRGNRQHTENRAQQQDTYEHGAKTETATQKRASFNDPSYSPNTQGQVQEQGYQDQRTLSAHIDTFTDAATEDNDQVTYGKKLTHYLDVKGNIGVTTYQQMAEQDILYWQRLNFYKMLLDDICSVLCYFHDDGYEPFNDLHPICFDITRETREYFNVFAVQVYYDTDGETIIGDEVLEDAYKQKATLVTYTRREKEGFLYLGSSLNGGEESDAITRSFIVTGPTTVLFKSQKVGE